MSYGTYYKGSFKRMVRKSTEKQKEFLDLYEPVHLRFTKFCKIIAGNIIDAEDLVNDSILAVFEQFESLNSKSSFNAYLFRIASNLNKKRSN